MLAGLRGPNRAAVAEIGWPSQNSCKVRACREVRVAEERSLACSKSAPVACTSATVLRRERRLATRWTPVRPSSGKSTRRYPSTRWRRASFYPPVVGGERQAAGAGCVVHWSPPGDGCGTSLWHPYSPGARAESPQIAELRRSEKGRIPYAQTVTRVAGSGG